MSNQMSNQMSTCGQHSRCFNYDGWCFTRLFISISENRSRSKSKLAGVDVLMILPTGFGKGLIYQVFCMAKQSSNSNASFLVISPLNNIVEEKVGELTKLGLNSSLRLIWRRMTHSAWQIFRNESTASFFCSAERCLSKEFQGFDEIWPLCESFTNPHPSQCNHTWALQITNMVMTMCD